MQTLKIPLGGITHSTSENAAKDGDMSELINLRHKDGTVQPVHQPSLVESFEEIASIKGAFIHRNANYAHIVGYNTFGAYWIATESDGVFEAISPVSIFIGTVKNIENIGHILIITDNDGLHRFIYKDNSYTRIVIPEAVLTINIKKKMASETPSVLPIDETNLFASFVSQNMGEATRVNDASSDEYYKFMLNDTARGAIYKAKDAADVNGWLYGVRFLRYAVKLYDGNYIYHSAPILIIPPAGYKNAELITASTNLSTFIYYLQCYSVNVSWTASLNDSLKGIISGVDIFISEEIQLSDYDNAHFYCRKIAGVAETVVLPGGPDGFYTVPLFRLYQKNSFFEDLESSSMFYKIHSLDYSKLTGEGEETIKAAKIREILTTKELLTDDAFTHNTIIPGCSYVYNQKLHLGDIKTKLFTGFTPEYFSIHKQYTVPSGGIPVGTITEYASVLIETKIRTTEGLKSVFTPELSANDILSYLSYYLAYPDARAERMIVWVNFFGVYYKKEYILKAHKYLNLAFYYDPSLEPIFIPSLVTGSQDSFSAQESFEYASNVMKASKTANPFYFAAENTYSADGRILGIASINESVSSGTAFGQNPIYLFTDRGIKILEVGTGEVYYTRMTDGPRDVLLNKKGILSLENGVIFPSSKGLIFLSGIHSKCLSLDLRGHWADELPADAKVETATEANVAEIIDLHLSSYSINNEGVMIITLDGVPYNVSLIPNDPELYSKVRTAVSAAWNTSFVYSPTDAIRFTRKDKQTSSIQPTFTTTTGIIGTISIQPVMGKLDVTFTDLYKHLTVFTFEEFFKNFMEDCNIGYNHIEDEIILSGRFTYQSANDTPVCFVLNLESGLWHKATYDVNGFIPDFPKLYGFRNDSFVTLVDFNDCVEPLEALFITRSIKFDSTAFKTMQRCVLRGDIMAGMMDLNGNPSIFSREDIWTGNKYNRLLVYGSQDSITWRFIGGIDKGGTMHDFGSKTFGVACKYFRVVYAGNPFYGSRFDFLEFLVAEKYAEKPR